MHYRHAYHAGNFADIFKHVMLCSLLRHYGQKPKPFTYLETHSGEGLYLLQHQHAQKTGEAISGIGLLSDVIGHPEKLKNEDLRAFAMAVAEINRDRPLSRYPGSPLFALLFLKEGCKAILCERQEDILLSLRRNIKLFDHDLSANRVTFHQRDGYELSALFPTTPARALMLVDPPFERPDEFNACKKLIEDTLIRMPSSVIAVWYPCKNKHEVTRFERYCGRIEASAASIRFSVLPKPGRMSSCGMTIINPPYGFAKSAEAALQELSSYLCPTHKSPFSIDQTNE